MTLSEREQYLASAVISLHRLGGTKLECQRLHFLMNRLNQRDFILYAAGQTPFDFALNLIFKNSCRPSEAGPDETLPS